MEASFSRSAFVAYALVFVLLTWADYFTTMQGIALQSGYELNAIAGEKSGLSSRFFVLHGLIGAFSSLVFAFGWAGCRGLRHQ
jgi:hypothetical protein